MQSRSVFAGAAAAALLALAGCGHTPSATPKPPRITGGPLKPSPSESAPRSSKLDAALPPAPTGERRDQYLSHMLFHTPMIRSFSPDEVVEKGRRQCAVLNRPDAVERT